MTLAGSPVTFDMLFRAERGRLLRYFHGRVGSSEAPDLVQEVFARFVGSGTLDRFDNPAAYLTRIARNMLIDRMRQRRRAGATFYSLDESRDAPARAEQAWRIEARDLLCVYRQAVRAMPPKTRRVFVMHRVRHLTYKQIAERIGISVATIEYHMMRALRLCRAAVAGSARP
jgi:RNA polymerase sigma-70 factor (ECF subfamily)